MFESFNSWIISLLSSFYFIDVSFLICIAIYITLILSMLIAHSSDEKLNEDAIEGKQFFCVFLFVLSLGFNVSYSFFMLPEHFIWITKILVFLFPYLIVLIFLYYLQKFRTK